ncbi:FAD-binding domain-containing protein [Plectosphaerella plurivora]|uniref:FAD-binding domain-containing protein n=1 Tax=Plectosphaerella plurivora TaxID=936078 RepID=A0A9P8VEX8_9PEZI|nr:FAD-binding domain-containing protein [Plectosphaerella plurivora]
MADNEKHERGQEEPSSQSPAPASDTPKEGLNEKTEQTSQETQHPQPKDIPLPREQSNANLATPQEQHHHPDGRRPSYMGEHPIRSSKTVTYLSDDEIKQFLDDLDHNDDGFIDYSEVEQRLDQAHDELTPQPDAHHVIKSSHDSHDAEARHAFLRIMMGSDAQRIPRADFEKMVREWKIPSLKQAKKEEEDEKSYIKRLPGWRKVRAYWAVHGPEIAFMGLVLSMILAFAIWQLVKYLTTYPYTEGFGWGVVFAKTNAGALYPTFFFLILSMSRYFSTWLRRSYYVSRFFNWDLSQEFHIRISCLALVFATLHAIGHLSGSFVAGSDPNREDAVAAALGPDAVPRPYIAYVRSRPGWTGLTALGLFWLLALMSMPQVRRWNYEVFQMGHLLMFPIIGLMMAHGTSALLQWPMFGYFLAFPTLLVLVERIVRISLGFHPIDATLRVLDDDTVEITTVIPSERLWRYKAGQYIFLQVPEISFFQWHPFTVSYCRGNKMSVHIKTDGNWTGRLRKMGGESGESTIKVGVNGPFGAPAQRFYDFNHSLIIGAGIGVTPFSGILADMQYKDDQDHGGPGSGQNGHTHDDDKTRRRSSARRNDSDATTTADPNASVSADQINESRKPQARSAARFAEDYRRVDFHWMVRDRNYLLWMSDLLNDVSRSQNWHHDNDEVPHLDIRINTHVTAKRSGIVTHVYRWLLEMHRTDKHPASPLTGLLNPTQFGRPDFDIILDEHYEEMRSFRAAKRAARPVVPDSSSSSSSSSSDDEFEEDEELKVGVFYCGAPVVGEILADKCRELTVRGREDGSKIEYHFMIEVFN